MDNQTKPNQIQLNHTEPKSTEKKKKNQMQLNL